MDYSKTIELLKNSSLTLASAESLTGGLFSSTITSYSGVSSFFKGGMVTYWTEIKNKVLNVDDNIIQEYGVVSSEVAYEMAKNIKEKFDTDIGISFTGNAGPTSMEGKPVGLVYIGLAFKDEPVEVLKLELKGNRNSIQQQCVEEGINFIEKKLKKLLKLQ